MTIWRLGVVAASKVGVTEFDFGGYFAGGETSPGTNTGNTEKFVFSNDTRFVLSSAIPTAVRQVSDYYSSTNGYVIGGFTSSTIGTSSKLAFANNTWSAGGATLGTARRIFAGGGQSTTHGYVSGGGFPSGPSFVASAETDKFAFSDDTRTGLTSRSFSAWQSAGISSTLAFYSAGGYSTSPGTVYSTINKWTFSGDTRSTLPTGMSIARQTANSFESSTAGYIGGGRDGPGNDLSTVDKITFSDDSRSTLGTGLSAVNFYSASGFESSSSGYTGVAGSGGYASTIDKFLFSNDSRTSLAVGLATGRNDQGGFSYK